MKLIKKQQELIYSLCVMALAFALVSDLFLKGLPEKIFYIVSYVAIIFTLHHAWTHRAEKIDNKPLIWLMLSLVLFALSRIIWGFYFKDTFYKDIHWNYVNGGKRLLLTAFMVFYFYKSRSALNKITLNLSLIILLAGLFYTLWLAIDAHFPNGRRIKLTADAATTAAYIIILVCITSLYLAFQRFKSTSLSIVVFFVIFSINITLVIFTGTRAAVIVTPLLYISFFFFYYRNIHKFIIYGCLALFLAAAVGTPYAIWDRMKNIQDDISKYQVKNDTSVGARFSIWKSGWDSVNFGIIGQSSDARTEKARDYIVKYERHNPEAWKNVAYHVHNDLLEVLSLQGVFGIFALLLFFICGVIFSLSRTMLRTNGVVFIIAPVFLLGLVDSVLIQSNSVLLICISLALMVTALKEKPGHSQSTTVS
ncbi:O-antigen ligase family protein [Pantoea sp. FN060301]|uniref:O-antigen ligase family protein n=1 Tax=Pantoea sp. FN060301 TaxID=3420380 RepID=UPI003D169748